MAQMSEHIRWFVKKYVPEAEVETELSQEQINVFLNEAIAREKSARDLMIRQLIIQGLKIEDGTRVVYQCGVFTIKSVTLDGYLIFRNKSGRHSPCRITLAEDIIS